MKLDCNRKHSTALGSIRSIAIGSIRLLSIAFAFLCAGVARAEISASPWTESAPPIRFESRAWAEGVLAANLPSIAVEGGRLQSNATWDASATHLVLNWVVVPSGVTLTIAEDTIVKLCPGAGIKVEDGGTLRILGAESAEAVVTTADDDSVGGSLGGLVPPQSTAVEGIRLQSSDATYSDNTHVRFTFSSALFPTLAVQDASAKRSDGIARIPVTVSGTTRDTAFRVDWRAVDGSAKFGEDYLLASGTLRWNKSSDGTKHVEIPLDPETIRGSNTAFRVELTAHYACNVVVATADVAVREFDFPGVACSGWTGSAPVRFDGRDGIAGAVATGTERLGEPDGSTNRLWDTTALVDGWQDIVSCAGSETNRLLAVNSPSIAVEGGRLQSNASWTSAQTHLVRHSVVVPSGCTLTVGQDAVVKFLPGTFIKVEDGGKLSVVGAKGHDAIFTAVGDDTAGAVLPGVGPEQLGAFDGIRVQSSAATFQDNAYLQTRGFIWGAYPYVQLNDTVAFRDSGMAYVPVSIASGTRNQAFSIDWVGVDGTATFGDDYMLASGTIEWTGTSQGTKTLQIPIVTDHIVGETTSFKLKISVCRACNPQGAGECTVTIRELDTIHFSASEATSAPVRFDVRESLGGRIVHAVETLGEPDGSAATAWNTAAFADGWHEIAAGGETASVLAINSQSIAVEGGRLQSNATWDASATHLVRHWVIVPSGKTLTVSEGAVVKICPDAGILVEDGGKLVANGADGDDVIFTRWDDDTAGAAIPGGAFAGQSTAVGGIRLQSSAATFQDNGWFQMRGVSCNASNIGQLSIHGAEVSRKAGVVYVAVTMSGNTRNQSFTADWEAVPGTAALGRDYTLASGRLTWSKSGDGTKWIAIPLNKKTETDERRTFKVRLKTVRGMDGTGGEATVEIREYEEGALGGGEVAFFPEGEGSAPFAIDEPVWKEPMFRHDEETIRISGAWQDGADPVETTVRLSWESENGGGVLAETPGNEPTTYTWRAEDWPVGSYTLRHDILDVKSGRRLATYQKTFAVPTWENVEMHGGTLTSNETWRAGVVHVVYETVRVPALYTILLEPGAIVKFLTGTGIVIEPGGGALFANGVVFTHINDDTVGGDTLNDGATLAPVMDAYTFTGDLTIGDESELRCKTQAPLSGTISGSRKLTRGSTYRVSGNVTIASGATLTIPAGTILKFDPGVQMTVNSGGTLLSNGTRAAPVVFTSIKDDEFGGDTNGDGDATIPGAGDWEELRNAGGLMELHHTHVLYGGYGQYSNQGDAAIRTTGGTTTLDNCVLAHSLLRLIGRSSGTVSATNCVLRDGRWGWDGAIAFVNGVVSDCTTGATGGTAVNSVFHACETAASGVSLDHCIAWECAAGTAGATVADPMFRDADAGDYRIREGSACIDAADSSAAPEKDMFGQKRWDFPAIANADAGAADIGVAECVPRDAASDVDLVPVSVKMSWNRESVKPGDFPYFFWAVANEGGEDVETDWWDEISLVSVASGRITVLGEYNQDKGVTAGGTTTGMQYFTIPALAPGDYSLRLNANSHRSDVPEGSRTDNNVLISETVVHVEVATEAAENGSSGMVQAGERIVRAFDVPSGAGSMLARVTAPAGAVVRYGLGVMPGEGTASGEIAVDASGQAVFAVPEGTESVYVVLESGEEGIYDIVFLDGALAVASVSPTQVPSSGRVTMRVAGAGFADGCAVSLVAPSGAAVTPVSLLRASAEELWATVDCAVLAAAGTRFALRVETDAGDATLENAVGVTAAEGQGSLWAELDHSNLETTRRGARITARIHYGNHGNVDIPAPILQVATDGGGELGYIDGRRGYEAIHFIGAGGSSLAGVLRPGEERTILFHFWPGESSSVYLYTSDGQTWFETPWTSMSGMLADFSTAATRIALRGQDATDYELVRDLALAVKNGEPASAIYGRVVDQYGAGVEGAVVSFTNATVFVSCLTDAVGRFCTTNLAAGVLYAAMQEFPEFALEDAIAVDGNNDAAQWFAVDVMGTLTVMVKGDPDGGATLAAMSLDDGNVCAMPWKTTGATHLFRGLSPGGYSVECCLATGVRKSQMAYLEEGTSLNLEFDFSRTGSLELDFGSIDTTNAGFLLYDGVDVERMVALNGDTSHTIEGLPLGDYTILFHIQGTDAYHAIPVTVSGGGVTNVDVEAEIEGSEDEGEDRGESPASASAAPRSMAASLIRFGAGMGAVTTFPDREMLWDSDGTAQYARELLLIAIPSPTGEYDCEHNQAFKAEKQKARKALEEEYLKYLKAVAEHRKNTAGKDMMWDGLKDLGEEATWGLIQKIVVGPLKGGAKIVATTVMATGKSARIAYKAYREGRTGKRAAIEIALELWNREAEILKEAGVEIAGEAARVFCGKLMLAYSIGEAFGKIDAGAVVQGEANQRLNDAITSLWRKCAAYENILRDPYPLCCPDNEAMVCDLNDYVDIVTPTIPQSKDPNEVVGPYGLGDPDTERFVKPGEWLDFTIYFENATNATASAREVNIREDLSPYLDWESIQLGEVVFANETDTGLAGTSGGTSEYAVPGTNYLVRTTFMQRNGLANWYLRLVDPEGDEDGWPLDEWLYTYGGFLPPNTTNHVGEGHVSYRIKVRDDAPKNVRIVTTASITFDSHETIPTDPSWWNTVGHLPVDLAFDRNCNDVVLDMPTNGVYTCDAPDFGTPTREGWIFLGWADTNGVARNCGADLPYDTAALNLYALWREEVETKFATIAVDGGVLIAGLADGQSCPADLVIPATVEVGGRRVKVIGVADDAFKGKRAIQTLTVMEGVRTIGARSFMNCTSLASVSLPSTIESIGENAFYGCRLLSSVTIAAETPPTLGSGAFRSVASAGALTVPDESEAAYGAWIGTDLGSAWTVEGYEPGEPVKPGEPAWTVLPDQNLLLYAAGATDIRWAIEVEIALDGGLTLVQATGSAEPGEDFVLPDPVLDAGGNEYRIVAIGSNSDILDAGIFEGQEFGSVTIPESVESIAPCAFANCATLSEVIFAGDEPALRELGEGAFFSCTSLVEIDLAPLSSLVRIGPEDAILGVFESCWYLPEVSLPVALETIGAYAFQDCSRLRAVHAAVGGNAVLATIGERAFYNCDLLETVEPGCLVAAEEIAEGAFGGDTSASAPKIVRITLGAGTASLGADVFLNASQLAEVTCLATNPPARDANAFRGMLRSGVLRVPDAGMEDYTNETARAWVGTAVDKLAPWNGSTGWKVMSGEEIDELREHMAYLGDQEYEAFVAMATGLGFTTNELCAIDHPDELLRPALKIISLELLQSSCAFAVQLENGIDQSPQEALARFISQGAWRMSIVSFDTLGGEGSRLPLSILPDANGTFEIGLGDLPASAAPCRFFRVWIGR